MTVQSIYYSKGRKCSVSLAPPLRANRKLPEMCQNKSCRITFCSVGSLSGGRREFVEATETLLRLAVCLSHSHTTDLSSHLHSSHTCSAPSSFSEHKKKIPQFKKKNTDAEHPSDSPSHLAKIIITFRVIFSAESDVS